MVKHKNKKLSK